MSAAQPGPREVTSGFIEAIRPALPASAPAVMRIAARDVAQIMGLGGLEAALVQIDVHAGSTRPVEVEHLADRIERVLEQAASDGDLAAFRAADREIGAIAAQLASTQWGAAELDAAPDVATWSIGETLADLALDAAPEVAHARLTMGVASALRAAIDWLGADESPRLVAAVHDSALTLTVNVTHEGGVGPAGAVLAAVEGSLGRESDGRWTLRVPRHTERPSYLLVRQGRFGFALPWHAVARLRMFNPHELDRLVEPRLDPLAALEPSAMERPAAMIAMGLVRAWFVADRIVWRIAAQSEEAESAAPFAGTSRVVPVENGERYWLLEPAWLLRGIAAPDVAPPSPRPHVSTNTLPTYSAPAPVAPAPEPEPARPTETLAEAVERALEALRPERMAAMRERAAREPVAPIAPETNAPSFGEAIDALLAFEDVPPSAEREPQSEPEVPFAPPMMFEAMLEVIAPEPAATPAPVGVAPAEVAPEPVAEAPAVEAPAETPTLDVAPALADLASAPAAETPVAEAPLAAEPEAPTEYVIDARSVADAPAPVAEPAPAASAEPIEASAPPARTSESAETLATRVAPTPVRAAKRASAADSTAPRSAAIVPAEGVRRALVVDDSLVARIFLTRMLEQRGWVVESVSDAAAMWGELARGTWDLVCADFALPDAQGREHVRGLVEHLARENAPSRFVVLTRDAAEERDARDAGASATLRKPFDAERLDSLLPR